MTVMWSKSRNSNLNKRGFTLLEVVVAIAILATAFFSLLVLHTQTVQMSYRSQWVNEATFALREKMAETILQKADAEGVIVDRDPPYEERYPRLKVTVQENALSNLGVIPIELRVPLLYYEISAVPISATQSDDEDVAGEGESFVIGLIVADMEE